MSATCRGRSPGGARLSSEWRGGAWIALSEARPFQMYDQRFPYTAELAMPVIGLESEFRVFVDGRETAPEDVWRTPARVIERALLKRSTKSSPPPSAAGGR